MNKLLTALFATAVVALALPVQAASHAGAAPMAKASEAKKPEMKASAPMTKASEAAKKEEKKK